MNLDDACECISEKKKSDSEKNKIGSEENSQSQQSESAEHIDAL